jgi:NADPH:quinone reductase-like Zn-dependent oxidoreductase
MNPTVRPVDARTSAPTLSMRAAVRTTYGDADVVHVARVPRPAVENDEVLVRVHAAGLDRGVWHIMTGLPYLGRLAFGLRRPKVQVLGFDLAGTVVAAGPKVTRFAVGDEVFGFGQGAFAEYAVAREGRLAPKPAALSFTQAAVVPVSAVTALQALDAGRVQAGQHVLVTGASGGVGSYVVQLAKSLGAEVTGTASAAKLDHVRSLGADHVLDHAREDFADEPGRYDVVVDVGGNPSVRRLRRALTATGTAVITGGEQGGNLTGGLNRQLAAVALSPFVRQRLTMVVGAVDAARLARLTELVEAGAVTPSLDRTFPLDEVPDALRYLAAGRVRGKVAITV